MKDSTSQAQQPPKTTGIRTLGPLALVGAGVLVFVLLLFADRTSLNTSAETPGGAARDGAGAAQMPAAQPNTEAAEQATKPSLSELPALVAGTESQVLAGLMKQLAATPTDAQLLQKLEAASRNAGRPDYAAVWADSLQGISKASQDALAAAKAYGVALETAPVADNPALRGRFARRGHALYAGYLATNAEDLPTRQAQALLYVESGDQQIIMEGIRGLRSLSEEHPEFVPAQLQMGLFSYNTGQFDKAEPRLKKVLAAEPGNVLAALYMGLVLQKLNRPAEAKPYFEQVRRTGGADPELVRQAEQAIRELNP
jgi:tetratricopeptide (TPR) repeat protein